MKFTKVLLLISILAIPTKAVAQADTFRVYFDFGISSMNEQAMKTIDSLIYNENLPRGTKLGILGYADYVGNEPSNVRLSEARSGSVKNYLLNSGFREQDIQMVIGKGEITRDLAGNNGYAPDRKVEIIPGGIKELPKSVPVAATPVQPPVKKIDISTVKKNETIRLDNIYFLPGSHMATLESLPAMQLLYNTLKDNPSLKIRIEGHICCLTNSTFDGYDYDAEDFHLSLNRARFIYDYLVNKGINKNQLQYEGYGNTRRLVNPELTEEDEAKNRRVEIRILAK